MTKGGRNRDPKLLVFGEVEEMETWGEWAALKRPQVEVAVQQKKHQMCLFKTPASMAQWGEGPLGSGPHSAMWIWMPPKPESPDRKYRRTLSFCGVFWVGTEGTSILLGYSI